MTPIGWAIYYADGTTFSSKDGVWADAPSHDVQVVVVYFSETYQCWHGDKLTGAFQTHNYRNVYHGAKRDIGYYWMADDGAIGAGMSESIPTLSVVKEGAWVNDAKFQSIIDEAGTERKWP